MSVQVITSINEANIAMTRAWAVAVSSGVRSELTDRILEISAIPVFPEALTSFAQTAYAHVEEFSEEFLGHAAALCDFATMYRWYGFGDDSLGLKISMVLRGEEVSDPPAVIERFKVAAPDGQEGGDL